MARFGVMDKPDTRQTEIVAWLRDRGWIVEITKRPVDLWVVSPNCDAAFWVEVKSSPSAALTNNESKFFARCPAKYRVKAYAPIEILHHYQSYFVDV